MKTILRKIATLLLVFVMAFAMLGSRVNAEGEDVVTILHTNDVHCGIDGYSRLAAYKKSFTNPVTLVDAGDHIMGDLIGPITSGQKIIEIMNTAGYDLAVPGNHEFDFQMDAFFALLESANYPYIGANFTKADGSKIDGVDPYLIMDLGGHKIGFVGVLTPETYTKSTPSYFQNDQGEWVYTFGEKDMITPVQNAIDNAKADGAEVIVAIAHTGIGGTKDGWKATDIIGQTNGIDVYLDGHSHEVIENATYNNKDGEPVHYQQTGTKLAYIGQVDITFAADGTLSYALKLIETNSLTDIDSATEAVVQQARDIMEPYKTVIGKTSCDLTTLNPETGNRAVRNAETNMGDFNADAYRILTGSDIALMQGGGVRANIPAGEITQKQLTDVNPWGNKIVKIEATGQMILDALEHGARMEPGENGGFFQVSGLTYEINLHFESPVIEGDQGQFESVKEGAPRRVQNVFVNGIPIDPEGTYTVSSTTYILQEAGDGMTMFSGAKVVEEYGIPDNQFLLNYLVNTLGGEVPTSYCNPYGEGRIKVLDEHRLELVETKEPTTTEDGYYKYVCPADGEESIIVIPKLTKKADVVPTADRNILNATWFVLASAAAGTVIINKRKED